MALDITKAFNESGTKLRFLNFPLRVSILLSDFLTGRPITTVADDYRSLSKSFSSGILQGSVLYPSLFHY